MDKTREPTKNRPPVHDSDFHDNDLARWLQEAGRRRVARKPEQALPEVIGAPAAEKAGLPAAKAASAPAEKSSLHRHFSHPRALILFAVAALAYLPYFFADVYVQISSLPCVIVFV